MPEIAEVALTAEILNNKFKRQKLNNVEFLSGKYLTKNPVGYTDFIADLPLTIRKVDSKGKFMWFELVSKRRKIRWYIFSTFGLTGMWSFNKTKYDKVLFEIGDNCVYYSDQLSFGTIKFTKNKAELDKKIKSLSPDLLKDDFDLIKIKKYKIPIVKILMDQTKIGSGIGNYLAAEILYRAKISPHRLGSELSAKDIEKLKYWIKYVIKLSYQDNHVGYMVNLKDTVSTIVKKNYHPEIKLKEKTFKFKVYRRKVDPLNNPVVIDEIVKGRSAHWVPNVQK